MAATTSPREARPESNVTVAEPVVGCSVDSRTPSTRRRLFSTFVAQEGQSISGTVSRTVGSPPSLDAPPASASSVIARR